MHAGNAPFYEGLIRGDQPCSRGPKGPREAIPQRGCLLMAFTRPRTGKPAHEGGSAKISEGKTWEGVDTQGAHTGARTHDRDFPQYPYLT